MPICTGILSWLPIHTLQHIKQDQTLTIFNLMIEPLAKAVRTHPLITGFQFGSSMHTINLFADNVILLLTNLLTSLKQAHKILTDFGDISYYKVNFTKSLILDVGGPPSIRNILQKQLPYMWSKRGITYLGITLTNTTSALVKANIIPLITKLETQLKDMSKKEISWLGKITAYKMLILPQILYIYSAPCQFI